MAVKIRQDDRLRLLRNVWLFSACTKRELARIARISTPVEAVAGETLAREGDPGREFFVIVSGEALVSLRGEKVGELGPGSFFGELALLDGSPRTATVSAATPMSLLVLTRGEFYDLLDSGMPSVARKMLVASAGRLRAMDERLGGMGRGQAPAGVEEGSRPLLR